MRSEIHNVIEYLSDFAWFWPGVAITIVVAVALAGRVARRLATSRLVGLLLLFGFGLIVSATLTPSREALRFGAVGTGTCDLSRFGPPTLGDILQLKDPAFNILLYVPLGAAVALLRGGRPRRTLLLIAILMPAAIELTQLEVRPLGRACQGSDIFDNLTGLFVGLIAGWAIGRAWRAWSGDLRHDPPGF